jgi:hypothetical protein
MDLRRVFISPVDTTQSETTDDPLTDRTGRCCCVGFSIHIDAMKDVRELAIKSQWEENEQLQVSVSDTGIALSSQPADPILNAFLRPNLRASAWDCGSAVSSLHRVVGDSLGGARFAFTLPPKIEGHG